MKTRTSLMLCVLAFIALAWATPAQAALVAYWDCDEGSGTNLEDYTASSHDGTLGNSMGWTSSGHTGLSGDNALLSNGNRSYVNVPRAGDLVGGNSSFTMTIWLKETYSGGYPYVFYTTGGGRRWLIQGENWGGDQAYVWSDSDGAWKDGLGFTITDNSYDMYAFTYSSSSMKSYRNGSLLSTVSVGSTWPTFDTAFRIGGKGDQDWTSFEGYLDDVSIWDANIGEARAKAMYNITTVNSGTLKDYGVDNMKTLFDVYDNNTPAWVDGTELWAKFTGGTGTAGSVTYTGGDYYAFFDGTSGVKTPEPATLALMGLGGLGLILSRKRR
jgi:hypothetical protein